MKFDIARAWKDAAYRQTLSDEQLNTLPANPAGEISESELSAVCGGNDGYGPYGFYGNYGYGASTSSSSAASSTEHRFHSYAVLCDINVFSADVHILGLDRLINIGNHETRPCLNND